MWELKKPIIGHNCSLDMYHLYDKFIDDLPLDIHEYKAKFHEWFPVIYDTKYYVNLSVGKQSKWWVQAKRRGFGWFS